MKANAVVLPREDVGCLDGPQSKILIKHRELVASTLFNIASDIFELTEEFFQMSERFEFIPAEFEVNSTKLMAAYDEYLDLLKRQIGSLREPILTNRDTHQCPEDPLIQLRGEFEENRAVLAELLDLLKEQNSCGSSSLYESQV